LAHQGRKAYDNKYDLIYRRKSEAPNAIFQDGYRYNKGGVMLGQLVPASERQTSLLDPYNQDKVAVLMQALDGINRQFGPGTLRYGSQGFRKATWQMRQNHLSSQNNQGLMTAHQQVKRICELGQSTALIRAL